MVVFNVVVLGAGGVGKSALTARYVKNEFRENYDPTIEENYTRSVVVDGVQSQLEILDTAGAEQFTSINEVYIQAALGFVLAFSLTQEASLREIDSLRQQIYRIKGDDTIPIVVVGTKADLANEREVQRATISSLANKWNHPFYETSAKRDWHVSEVFDEITRQMRAKYPQGKREFKSRHKKKGPCIIM